ncbi:hypothetical protein PybrP1_007990 [[Pythium] brassicae (nom. inval.)]|nr:hypothetical protein PybrP1_007990 [[Pythium] brassicae (nom. inval.)]
MAGGSLFPLPSNFFPRLELTAEEAASFQEWGDRLVQETVDAYHRDQLDSQEQKERKWKTLKQRGGLTAFRRRKSAGEEDYKYLCTGIIEGTLDEIVCGRYADESDHYRRTAAVYRDDLVDCAILHTIEAQSPARPFYYSGFKWMTVQSPGHGLVKNRDVCWYEQNGFTRDRNGKEIGYTLTESVMDYIADQKSAELWLRAERNPAVTQAVVATTFIEYSKSLPQATFDKRKCDVCDDRIGTMMSAAKQCAMCRHFMCSRCIVKKRVLSSLVDFTAVCRENFCKKCLRYVSDVNLRDPQSLYDVWQFATSSMNDPTLRAYPRPFETDRSTDSSRNTDEGREKPRKYSAAQSVDSDGSNRSFRHLPPPPMVGAKPMQLRQPPPQFQQPVAPKKPSMRSNMNMTLLQPVPTGESPYDTGSARGPPSSSDGNGSSRHVPQYATSSAPSVSTGSSSRRGGGSKDYYDQQPAFSSQRSNNDNYDQQSTYSSQRSNKDYYEQQPAFSSQRSNKDSYEQQGQPTYSSQRSNKDYYDHHKSFASDLTTTTTSTVSNSSRYASLSEHESHQPLTAAALQAHHKAVGS